MQNNKKTETWCELSKMKPIKVKLEQICLNPNNPRIEVPMKGKVSEDRIYEKGIQGECLEKLKEIGLSDLIGSISNSGFSTVDRVVLRYLKNERYVVVEGNRRVATLKILVESHRKGHLTLPEEIIKKILEFEALLYTGENPDIAWIVQGFRHTPGIKSWDDYPKAKFIATFEKESSKSPQEISSIFGMKKREVSNLIRWYYGFEQAVHDDEFGDVIETKDFGLFKEVIFKRKPTKDWLGWNDEQRKFKEEDNLKRFLSWVEENKIDDSPSSRDTLARIVQPENEKLLKEFYEGKLHIKEYAERISEKERARPTIEPDKILRNLKDIRVLVSTLPIPLLRKEKYSKKKILQILEDLHDILVDQIKSLKKQR